MLLRTVPSSKCLSQPSTRLMYILHCTIQGVITFSRMEWYHKRLHMRTSQRSHLVDQNSYARSLCTWTPNPKLMPPTSTERANCSTARPAFSEGVGKGATLLPPPGFNPTFLICRHKIKLHTISLSSNLHYGLMWSLMHGRTSHLLQPCPCPISSHLYHFSQKKGFSVWDATQVMCNLVDWPIELQWL